MLQIQGPDNSSHYFVKMTTCDNVISPTPPTDIDFYFFGGVADVNADILVE